MTIPAIYRATVWSGLQPEGQWLQVQHLNNGLAEAIWWQMVAKRLRA